MIFQKDVFQKICNVNPKLQMALLEQITDTNCIFKFRNTVFISRLEPSLFCGLRTKKF